MSNVLIVVPNDSLGGAEQCLFQIAKYNCKIGNKVYVIFLKRKCSCSWDQFNNKNIFLIYGNNKKERFCLLSFIFNVFKYWNISYDYAYTSHVHTTCLVGISRFLRLLKIKKHVARESTSIFYRFNGTRLIFFKIMYFIGYNNIDLLICQTEEMRNQFVRNLSYLERSKKIVVLSNPVDIYDLKIKDCDYCEFSVSYKYIIAAGRLINEKGFDILIKSYNLFLNNNNGIKLLILGSGPRFNELRDQVEDLGLSNKVYLLGFKDNVVPYFRNALLCVVSSRIEGFPNVLLQMMYSNTRVVSTLCAGGIDEIPNIVKAQPNSVEALYEAMELGINISDSQSNKNRIIFDKYLSDKSINAFMNRVDSLLN